MEILGSLVGAASGGLLGVAGSLIGKVAGYFELKQKMKLEQIKNNHSLALMDKQAELQKMAQDGKFQLTSLETDSANLIGSYKHDASYGETYKWASSMLRFVRPLLTFSVIGVFVFVYYKADEFGDVNTVQRMSNEICFLASTCLSWWFADRSRK
tara:strand:+ start:591 stop:1055 length:465 start_codon:yes stop_codon:yes gene_type:complete